MQPVDDQTTWLREELMSRVTRRLAISTAEAAELLGCSERAIYNLMYAGKLRSFKHGPKRRIPTLELFSYIEREVHEATLALESVGNLGGYEG